MMWDPTGLSQIAIAKSITIVSNELKAIYQCKDKGKALGDLVEKVQPVVPDASGTALAGYPVKEWLDNLNKVLDEAEQESLNCKNVRRSNILKTRRLSKRIKKIREEIEDILKQSSIPVLCVEVQTNQTANEIKQKTNEINQTVDEINPKTDEIIQKLNEMKDVLDRYVREDTQRILDNRRQLPDKIFGTDASLVNLENLLLGGTENKWVVVYGSGGIGKTLLAEKTFNSPKVREHFEQQFFITVGQKRLITDLLKNLAEEMKLQVENMLPADARTKLFNALKRKKVLLVLDDVWDDGVPVLESLNVTSGPGSKILVTTRHVKVLKTPQKSIVKIEVLTDNDSWKLFCEHAFGGIDNIPRQLDQRVIKEVVRECKGLPLALKVIGRALSGETLPKTWQRQLKKLRKAQLLDAGKEQEHQLYRTLRLSYDSLQPHLQKCFVYFAAFPEDYDVPSAKLAKLWAGDKLQTAGDDADDDVDPSEKCFYWLIELVDRSLIDVRWSDHTDPYSIGCRMHDVLRDFARYLISQNEAPMDCRFQADQDLKEVPSNWLQGASNVTHLSLYNSPLESLPNELKAPKLEVLVLSTSEPTHTAMDLPPTLVISPEFLESFSNLKVLDLENRPIKSLPERVGSLKNLIYLDLSKTGLRKLPVGLQELTKLENLSLQGCTDVEPWPFDISRLKSLTTLKTDGCTHIWDPVPVHTFQARKICESLESLCEITKLRNLSISSAHHERLPSQMRDSLSHIACLSLSFCSNLKALPNLHELQDLAILDLSSCSSLLELPIGFTKTRAFPSLQRLDLAGCEGLQQMPPIKDGAFPQLKILDMRRCSNMQQLPNGFAQRGAFPALEKLFLNDCKGLQEMPPIQNGAFSQLKILGMRRCSNIQQLPNGFAQRGAFPTLERLYLDGCNGLREIPRIEDGAFPQLEVLDMSNCSNINQLPNGFTQSGAFPALQELVLHGCKGLQELPRIENGAFPQLEKLDMRNCSNIEQLPNGFTQRGAFPSLERLNLNGWKGLQEIPHIEDEAFPQLKELYLEGCKGLQEITHIEDRAFPQLKVLDMRNCSTIQQLPNGLTQRGAFPSLEKLYLMGCKGLQEIPHIEDGAFPELKVIDMRNCSNIQQLPNGFTQRGAFPSLEELYLLGCKGLQEIPHIEDGAFPELKLLDLRNCSNIQQLPNGFTQRGAFPSLEKLYLLGCKTLQEIPHIEDGAFPKLKLLNMTNCSNIQQLPNGFTQRGAFPSLEILDFEGCNGLREIPHIEHGAFPQLKVLDMRNCSNIQKLPNGFTQRGAFPSLEILDLEGCNGLQEIPHIEDGAFPQLKTLDLEGCNGLQEIPHIEDGAFPQLKVLDMRNCSNIQQLPNGFTQRGVFPSLERLHLEGCNGLQEIPLSEDGAFPPLMVLNTRKFSDIEQLPNG